MRPYAGTHFSDMDFYPGKMLLRSTESKKSKVINLIIRLNKRARARLKADLRKILEDHNGAE